MSMAINTHSLLTTFVTSWILGIGWFAMLISHVLGRIVRLVIATQISNLDFFVAIFFTNSGCLGFIVRGSSGNFDAFVGLGWLFGRS